MKLGCSTSPLVEGRPEADPLLAAFPGAQASSPSHGPACPLNRLAQIHMLAENLTFINHVLNYGILIFVLRIDTVHDFPEPSRFRSTADP